MVSLRTSVGIGLLAAASAFSTGPALPLSRAQGSALAPQHPPALRRSEASISLQMVDEVMIQGGLAAAAGLGVAIGGIYFIEKKAAAADADEMVDKMAGMGIAMEGAEGSNQFSGSDQSLDALIAGMEEAQGVKKEDKPKEVVTKKKVDDDDGW